jgi:hypothetical protein
VLHRDVTELGGSLLLLLCSLEPRHWNLS